MSIHISVEAVDETADTDIHGLLAIARDIEVGEYSDLLVALTYGALNRQGRTAEALMFSEAYTKRKEGKN